MSSLLLTVLLASLGCAMFSAVPAEGRRAPPIEGEAVPIRGATEQCRATYVFSGPVHEDAGDHESFYQYPATLDGVDFGACTLMGPTQDHEWLWVVMIFEPGFRGQTSCWSGRKRSATLEVVDSAGPVPDGFVAKYHFIEPGDAAAKNIPTYSTPCPDLESVQGVVRKPLGPAEVQRGAEP